MRGASGIRSRYATRSASAEHFEFWSVAADIYRGTALGNLGDPDIGITVIQRGLDVWNAMGVGAFRGYWQSVMAGIEQRRGRPHRGLEIVESELDPAAESLERLCYAIFTFGEAA